MAAHPISMQGPDLTSQRSEALLALDRKHVWHPFTHMQPWIHGEPEPLIITEAHGMKVRDQHGSWYYDGTGSIWVNVHGHRHPKLDAALLEQLERVAHTTMLGQSNVPAILLAERLSGLTGHALPRVFYGDNGSGAVEAAIKIAVQYHANRGNAQRTQILGFDENYHGDTLGAVSVAADELFHKPFLELIRHHPKVPFPYPYRSPHGADPETVVEACLQATRETLATQHERMAAVIVEPVQGAGGIIPAPPAFLRGLRALCDEFGLLLIVDEVATGFGRTGTVFAYEQAEIAPDLLCVGKGLTGGYLPVAATLAAEHVFEAFLGPVDSGCTFFHGHSYAGNQLGCAVALASCELLVEEVLPTLPAKIAQVGEAVADWAERFEHVGEVRQAGMMLGIELVADKSSKAHFAYRHQPGYVVSAEGRKRGLIVRPIGPTLISVPPLAATHEELGEMLALLEASLEAAQPELARRAAQDDQPNR